MRVRNLSSFAISVEIVNTETNERTQVNLQPHGKVTLPKNFIVDNNFLARNSKILKTITE